MSYRFRFSGFVVALAALLLVQVSVAKAQCASPVGAAGDLTYNDSEYVMQWCDGTNWYGIARSPYIPNAVNFDGTNDYLNYSSALTGATESNQMTVSFWARYTGQPTPIFDVIYDTGEYNRGAIAAVNTSEQFEFYGFDNTGTVLVRYVDQNNTFSDQNWHHVMFSIALSNTSNRHVYIDGILDSGTWLTYTDGSMDFDNSNGFLIGSNSSVDPSRRFTGNIADLWIDFGAYIDLSIAANRRQFIDANGWPVDLGTDGSKATGAIPDIYLSGATAAWHTNKGTGGGFTENGALTDAPADPGENLAVMDGLVGWWKLDETAGTTAVDSAGSNDGTMTGGLSAANDNVDGTINNALNFDGVDDSISTATFALTDITMFAWVKTNDITSEQYPINIYGSTSDGWGFRILSGNIALRDDIDNADTDIYSAPIQSGKWHHITATMSSGLVNSMYLDGALIGSGTTSSDNVSSMLFFGPFFWMGARRSTTLPFDGTIDDARIYDRVLSATEITELYETGFPCKNPVAQRDGDTVYNLTHHVPQFCNLREWKAMALQPGDGGARLFKSYRRGWRNNVQFNVKRHAVLRRRYLEGNGQILITLCYSQKWSDQINEIWCCNSIACCWVTM